MKYVKVAHSQAQVMHLGGNMPDTLIEFAMLGQGGDKETSGNNEIAETAKGGPQ